MTLRLIFQNPVTYGKIVCAYKYKSFFLHMQVSVDGFISLDKSISRSTPRSLPLTGTEKIIAPYWADVDTRGTGDIYYRQTTDPSLLARATSEIKAAFPDSLDLTITNMFIATWDRVGYYYRNTNKVSLCVIFGTIKILRPCGKFISNHECLLKN